MDSVTGTANKVIASPDGRRSNVVEGGAKELPKNAGGIVSVSGSGNQDISFHNGRRSNIVELNGDAGSTAGIVNDLNHTPKRLRSDIEPECGGKELIVYTATRCKRARLEPNYMMKEKFLYSDLPPAENPFFYGKRINFPSFNKAKDYYDRLLFSGSSTTKKLWIVHTEPTLLKISGSELIENFQEYGRFTSKTYECIRRMMDEKERSWYGMAQRRRWRKVLAKEWAEMVLDGGDYINHPKMREIFAGGQRDYALDTCQLIWVMHETKEGYCVMFAFDMDLEIIHVFYPKRTCAGIRILEKVHAQTCEKLLTGLLGCVDAFFEGWEQDRSWWKFNFHDYVNGPCRTEDTPVYGMHYILSFDGMYVTEDINKESVDYLRKKLMYLVVKMEGNLVNFDESSEEE